MGRLLLTQERCEGGEGEGRERGGGRGERGGGRGERGEGRGEGGEGRGEGGEGGEGRIRVLCVLFHYGPVYTSMAFHSCDQFTQRIIPHLLRSACMFLHSQGEKEGEWVAGGKRGGGCSVCLVLFVQGGKICEEAV